MNREPEPTYDKKEDARLEKVQAILDTVKDDAKENNK